MDIIFKIFDILSGLYKDKKSEKRLLFETFIEPAMSDITVVHQDYIKSFETYYTMISWPEMPLTKAHPIYEKLKTDSLFSRHLRDKVYTFYDNTNKEEFDGFTRAIYDYFQMPILNFKKPDNTENNYLIDGSSNAIRGTINRVLTFTIGEKETEERDLKSVALKRIKSIMEQNAVRYNKILHEFFSLKNQFYS